MSRTRDEEDEDECFYESLDRLVSSSCSCSTSNSDDENDNDDTSPNCGPDQPFPVPKFPRGVSKYDIWISEPSSVSERRGRLLRAMGLNGDPALSRAKPGCSSDRMETGHAEFSRSVSSEHMSCHRQEQSYGDSAGISQSKSDDSADHLEVPVVCRSDSQCNSYCSSSASVCVSSSSILSIHSVTPETGSFVHNDSHVVKSSRSGSSFANGISPNKPPSGKNGKRVDDIQCDSTKTSMEFGTSSVDPTSVNACDGEVVERLNCNGIDGVDEQVYKIKDLDNGKVFVVNEIREDGMWKKLKEVGTGRQLTMEEFEMTVGHSPIVQEVMRRQHVEDGNQDNQEPNANGIVGGGGSKMKKKGGWLKSIVATTMASYKERRSSDERDTSSEKGGRRSSSATDDSQDVSFHGPERVRVKQYGKSHKELTALYKSQEIQAHSGSIWSIKFSLDGKYLASAGEDCEIHVWQVVESEKKGDLLMEKPEDGNFNLLFLTNGSPEPNSLSPNKDNFSEKKRRGRSSLSRKSLSFDHVVVPDKVFGLTEKPICSFRGHSGDVLDLSWSKSEHLLSSSMDKTVRLWNLSSKSCLKVFSHSDFVTCIQFNPVDDRYFISGSLDQKVRIWSIPDRQVVDWNDLHEMVTAACYTPDGQGALVGSYKGSCLLYNTSENKLQQKSQINLQNKKKRSHHKKITGFQFLRGSSSEALITSADSRIRVVDGVDLIHKFKGFRNTNSQISASITANGRYLVSASDDSHVYVWKHEGDSRPNRSKGVTITRSFEHFHCQDVSVAIPWPGSGDAWALHGNCSSEATGFDNHLDEASTANHPPTPVEDTSSDVSGSASGCTTSPLHGTISSSTNSYFFDRISATWPEEKLILAARNRSPRVSVDFTNGVNQNVSAWGMVIVTAGLRGEIRTFQNFGLPLRI